MENFNVEVGQYYAPTNDAEEERKEDFYNRFQSVVDNQKEKDLKMLMGDFNASMDWEE